MREIRIGSTREEVTQQIRASGIVTVFPHLLHPVEVRTASQLETLARAEGLIVGAGASIEFDGDSVRKIYVTPVRKSWQEVFRDAETRADVLVALKEILEEAPGTVIRTAALDSKAIDLESMSESDTNLLLKYGLWESTFRNDEGYWHYWLEFEGPLLKKIRVAHSAGELP